MEAMVPRWGKGAERITALIEARHLQRVTCDPDTVRALVVSARRHLDSARLTARHDPEATYTLAYDAARKSATVLLSHQGLRPTTAGGHLAVVDAISAQFPGVPGLTSLDRLRRRRNQAECPDPRSYDPITPDEASSLRLPARGRLLAVM
jgi:YD repeat-containing protein